MGFTRKRKEEYDYFTGFEKSISYSGECAKMLSEVIKNYNQSDLKTNLERMHEIEHKGDDEKHKMINYLMKDFLPPIEREDIMNLAQKVDDVTDLVEEILINISMFNIAKVREDANSFTELLERCCRATMDMLSSFKNFKKADEVKQKIIEINVLEEEGDRLFIQSMSKLYRDGTSTEDIIKWTTIYNCFENCFDRCEDVADDVEGVVLKNL